MYDTIKLWLPSERVGSYETSKVCESLTRYTEHFNEKSGKYISGYLGDNFRVGIYDSGISLQGSLAKYFLSDNFHTLTRSDSELAFEQIGDAVHLPINRAKVSRIDFSQNFIMNYKPEAYYTYLGDCQFYNRLTQEKSLYYSNKLRTKLFYNKVAWAKAKNVAIPDVLKDKNVLRYEMRYMTRLPKEFNKSEVLVSDLIDENFYIGLFDKWYSEYESINKLNSINLNFNSISSPKDFMKHLCLYAIDDIGFDKIMSVVEEMRHLGSFNKPEYYSRLKKNIRELGSTPSYTNPSELMLELDGKIKDAKRYYR